MKSCPLRAFFLPTFLLFLALLSIVTDFMSQPASCVIPFPADIQSIEVSGYYNHELTPWSLHDAEIAQLRTWMQQLYLKHKIYREGEAPNQRFAGGISYTFHINNGALSFTYSSIDTDYIWYDSAWYEIRNPTIPPIGDPTR